MKISELWSSRKGTLGKTARETLSCRILFEEGDNPNDTPAMLQFALQNFPLLTTFGNVFDTVDWDPIEGDVGFVVSCNYKSPPETRQTNSASFSFNTGGGTQHITHSLKTVSTYGPTSTGTTGTTTTTTPPNFQQGINVTADGPQGVDIHIRTFDFKTTFYVATTNMTDEYIDSLYKSTGCVNEDEVSVSIDGINLSFDSGELLMLGSEGQKRIGFNDWELSISWSGLPNVSGQTIGSITGISCNGWDYLWVYTMPQPDPPTGEPLWSIHQPIGVYVEQVYVYVPLTPLLLSTAFGQTNTQPWLNPTATSDGGFGE